ncbi:MAG: hypothetical protein ABW034_10145 [Steroidobacteraceae bacterium]
MRVLIVYHSFTGQAEKVARSVLKTLAARSVTASLCRLDFAEAAERLQAPVSFGVIKRWGDQAKRGTSVPFVMSAQPMAAGDFDAVVLLSNTWMFHPAVPIQSFLRDQRGRGLLTGKPVAIGIVCRGFWRKNLGITTSLVQQAGGRVVTHEVFRHAGSWLRSTITNINGMTKTTPLPSRLGPLLLPPFGVSPESMARVPTFVDCLLQAGPDNQMPKTGTRNS